MKKSTIKVEVNLDENHVPETINWSAPDGGIEAAETRAAFLSFWDEPNKEALRIDLWTKEMPMDDMKIFFHQMISSLSRTYDRATSEPEVAKMIADFAEEFAIASGIKDKK